LLNFNASFFSWVKFSCCVQKAASCIFLEGHAVAQLTEAPHYKPEVRRFGLRFFIDTILVAL